MLHFSHSFLIRSSNVYILTWITNSNILILIPPSEVQESKSFKFFIVNIHPNYFYILLIYPLTLYFL